MSDRGLEGLRKIVGPVSRETFDDLLVFARLFRKWTERINLAAPSTIEDLWTRHILDSAQLVRLAPASMSWVDLGSGGGLPGLVIAILLKNKENATVQLIESNRKKAAFLQVVKGELALPVSIHAVRIESAVAELEPPEVVTARALAPLDTLLGLAAPFLTRGTRALFHKGRDYRREIEESAERWTFDLLEHPSSVERDSVVLDISNLRLRQNRA